MALAEPAARRGLAADRGELRPDPLDDGGGRSGRQEERVPGFDREAGEAGFGGGRHVWIARGAPFAGHHDRDQTARLDVRQTRADPVDDELGLTGDHVGHGGRRALIGHVDEPRTGALHEQHRTDVGERGVAGGGEVVGARPLAQPGQHVRERAHGEGGRRVQHQRDRDPDPERDEIAVGIVGQRREQVRRRGEVARPEEERPAVGRGPRGGFGPDRRRTPGRLTTRTGAPPARSVRRWAK